MPQYLTGTFLNTLGFYFLFPLSCQIRFNDKPLTVS